MVEGAFVCLAVTGTFHFYTTDIAIAAVVAVAAVGAVGDAVEITGAPVTLASAMARDAAACIAFCIPDSTVTTRGITVLTVCGDPEFTVTVIVVITIIVVAVVIVSVIVITVTGI